MLRDPNTHHFRFCIVKDDGLTATGEFEAVNVREAINIYRRRLTEQKRIVVYTCLLQLRSISASRAGADVDEWGCIDEFHLGF